VSPAEGCSRGIVALVPRGAKRILVGFGSELKAVECRVVMTPIAMLK
jgi:hypothetical protein